MIDLRTEEEKWRAAVIEDMEYHRNMIRWLLYGGIVYGAAIIAIWTYLFLRAQNG